MDINNKLNASEVMVIENLEKATVADPNSFIVDEDFNASEVDTKEGIINLITRREIDTESVISIPDDVSEHRSRTIKERIFLLMALKKVCKMPKLVNGRQKIGDTDVT